MELIHPDASWSEKAHSRVSQDPQLQEHADILLDYLWPGPEHDEWVATATKDELYWADIIKREGDEEQDEEQ